MKNLISIILIIVLVGCGGSGGHHEEVIYDDDDNNEEISAETDTEEIQETKIEIDNAETILIDNFKINLKLIDFTKSIYENLRSFAEEDGAYDSGFILGLYIAGMYSGACGGSVGVEPLSTKDVDGTFDFIESLSVTYDDFCNEGLVLNGHAEMIEKSNSMTGEVVAEIKLEDYSEDANGAMYQSTGSITIKDSMEKTYELDLELTHSDSRYVFDIFIVENMNGYSISGWCENDYGRMQVVTDMPISEESGQISCIGDVTATLNIIDNETYFCEIDNDNDGIFDWNSGVKNFDE